jgi:hypothetical protein
MAMESSDEVLWSLLAERSLMSRNFSLSLRTYRLAMRIRKQTTEVSNAAIAANYAGDLTASLNLFWEAFRRHPSSQTLSVPPPPPLQ